MPTEYVSGFYPELVSPWNRQVVKALSTILGPLPLSKVEPDATEFSFSHQYSCKVAAPAFQAQHLHWVFVRCSMLDSSMWLLRRQPGVSSERRGGLLN